MATSQQALQFAIRAINDASGPLKDVGRDVDVLGNKASGAGARLQQGLGVGVKVAAAAATAGITAAAGGIAFATNAAMNFESQISAVGAVSGATKDELRLLGDTALRIGRETVFSATEAAGAMEILAASGISVTDIMGGAADAVAALAAAGGTTLAIAADVTGSAMGVWNIKASEMTDVINRVAGAANVSKFNVEDMALAISQGGGVAAAAGIEFSDFTTAMAAIAPSFASGSDAGTSFKAMVNALTPTTDKAKQSMRDLGLMTAEGKNQFFDAQGAIKPLAEIAGLLNDAFKDLSEEQRATALETIFLTDGMRAADFMARQTRSSFAAMSKTMGDTSAAELARMRLDNAKGAMEALKGAIEVVSIQLGREFTPMVKEAALWLADKLPKAIDDHVMPAIERFKAWFKENRPQIESAFNAIKDAVETFAKAFVNGMGTIMEHKGLLVLAIAAIGAAIVLSLGPVSLAIVAVAGLITIVGALREKFGDKALLGAIAAVGLAIAVAFGPAGAAFVAVAAIGAAIGLIATKISEVNAAASAAASAAHLAKEGGYVDTSNLGYAPAPYDIPLPSGYSPYGPPAPLPNYAWELEGMAMGGLVRAGQRYWVGERGPELFQSAQSGSIVPNHALGGDTFNLTVNVPMQLGALVGRQEDVETFVVNAVNSAVDRGLRLRTAR